MRLNTLAVSLDFSVSDLFKKQEDKKPASARPAGLGATATPGGQDLVPTSKPVAGAETAESEFDEYGYLKFNTPWSMDVSYSVSYYKPAFKSTISQALTVRGHLQLTKKMNITYTTGYDFTGKEITMTQIGITRDLHCWDMSFNWVPNGNMKMWEFSIKVKASVLADLKYERRKDYHDNY
jgi:hypothetical protein